MGMIMPARLPRVLARALATLAIGALIAGLGVFAVPTLLGVPDRPVADRADTLDVVVAAQAGAGRSAAVRISNDSLLPFREDRLVAGLVPQRVYADVEGHAISARWVYAPGANAVNTRIDTWLREQFAAHAHLAGRPWPAGSVEGAPPGGMDSDRGCLRGSTMKPVAELLANRQEVPLVDAEGYALVVTCDVVEAAGDVLGIRMRASEVRFVGGLPMLVSDRSETFWADLSATGAGSGGELFAQGGTPGVRDALAAGIALAQGTAQGPRRVPVAQRLREGVEVRSLLGDAAPLSDGSVVVRLPASAFEPTRDGVDPVAIEVHLRGPQLVGALTPFGERARLAADLGTPWAGAEQPVGLRHIACDLVPCISLTFDDGPGPFTASILDSLEGAGATGTFFVVGKNVEAMPELVARMATAGHVIGNHTYSHIYFPVTPIDQIQAQLDRTDAAVRAAAGITPEYLRPPWAAFDHAHLASYGRPIALWTSNSLDWQEPPASQLVTKLGNAAAPGAIVLMHDVHAVTAEAMPVIVADLQARGYQLVGLDQLIGHQPRLSVTMNGYR